MFFGFNLNEILMFPLKEENRKHLYMGIAVSLLAFIVPIAPYIVLFGYGAQIAKQILNGESPHLVAWDDWGKLFKDGLKVFGARFIVGIPILFFALPILIVSFVFPFLLENANPSEVETILPIYFLVIFGGICFIIPISLVMAVIIPAAEMKVIETDDFSALFRFKEWWKIFSPLQFKLFLQPSSYLVYSSFCYLPSLFTSPSSCMPQEQSRIKMAKQN
jgi:hypothetical protein